LRAAAHFLIVVDLLLHHSFKPGSDMIEVGVIEIVVNAPWLDDNQKFLLWNFVLL